MTRRLTVKKEIRTLGLDLCNPRRLVGAVVRGGTFLDGVLVFPSKPIPESKSIGSAILGARFFPELRLIMTHDPKGQLDTKGIDTLTGLPVLQISSAGNNSSTACKPYKVGTQLVHVQRRLPRSVLQ